MHWKRIVKDIKALSKGEEKDVLIRFLRHAWPRIAGDSHDTAFLRLALIDIVAFVTDNLLEHQARKLVYETSITPGYEYVCNLIDWIKKKTPSSLFWRDFHYVPSARYFLDAKNPSYNKVFGVRYYELYEIAKAGRYDILKKIAKKYGLVEGKTVFDMLREYQGQNRDAVAFLAFYFVAHENAQELADLLFKMPWIQRMRIAALVGTNFPEVQLLDLIMKRVNSEEFLSIMGYWPEGVKKAIKMAGLSFQFLNGKSILQEGACLDQNEKLLFALSLELYDFEIIDMLDKINPMLDVSKAAFFAICLGGTEVLVKALVKKTFRTLVSTVGLLKHAHHIPEHLVPFLASENFFCTSTFTRIHYEKALGPSLQFLEKYLTLIPEKLFSSYMHLLLHGVVDSRTALSTIKHIVKERKESAHYHSFVKNLKSTSLKKDVINTPLALFLLSEMDGDLVEQSLLNYGVAGLIPLLDNLKN